MLIEMVDRYIQMDIFASTFSIKTGRLYKQLLMSVYQLFQ